MTPAEFRQKQSLPYEAKIAHAIVKAQEFYDRMNGEVFCSVGGLDSITLLVFLRREIAKDIPGASVSILEDRSIQAVHQTFDNFMRLKPLKSKTEVLREFGYPVISKEKAGKIHLLQNPTVKNATVRHAIMTGKTGKLGGYKHSAQMRLPQKWLELFGGPENQNYGTHYQTAPFKVSNRCCYYLKERPCELYTKSSGRKPYLGLMASEGGQRAKALTLHGCNYYGKTISRSCPFAIFSRQDLLRLALDLNVPVPKVYGRIEQTEDGTLYTTRAQRTGCSCCGFGIHLEKRPHRFDRLRVDNYNEWKFWMYTMNWGQVLDYIGVEWENEWTSTDYGNSNPGKRL
jgi:hypothetical protein